MNFIFLMDPLETVIQDKDTSFILMLGAHRKGHRVFFLPDGGITRKQGRTQFHVTEVTPQSDSGQPFRVKSSNLIEEQDIDAVFIRTDPPFSDRYLHNTWLLDLLPKGITVINNPTGIRIVNEKIWATQFTDLTPSTLIGRNPDDLLAFLKEEQNIVVKPTDGFGGRSVFHIKDGDVNTNVILETLTDHWSVEIIAQKFIPQAKHGDKRILLLNGDPLGAVLRVHAENDHRNNFLAGGQPRAVKITNNDRRIIDVLKGHLQTLGLYFVGIDILGDYLIEVNVTSPTCLQEMNRLYNQQLEDQVIGFVEKLIDQNQENSTISNSKHENYTGS